MHDCLSYLACKYISLLLLTIVLQERELNQDLAREWQGKDIWPLNLDSIDDPLETINLTKNVREWHRKAVLLDFVLSGELTLPDVLSPELAVVITRSGALTPDFPKQLNKLIAACSVCSR